MNHEPAYACPSCQLGVLQSVRSVYFTTIAGWPLCAQDVPAWHCSICGFHEYDPDAVTRLLNPAWPGRAERASQRRRQLDSETGGGSPPEDHRHGS